MNQATFIPILTYHGLSQKGNASDGLYTLTEEQFETQMNYLKREHFRSVSLGEFLGWRTGRFLPEKSVVITFDDGLASDDAIALPILKRCGLTATFFVNPGTLDTENHLTTEGLKRLSGEGMDVGSHGFDHVFLTRLDDEKVRDQLTRSKKRLEEILKKEISFFSIPRGRYNYRILEAVREAGYQAACSSDIGVNRQGADLFRLKRWTLRHPYTLDDVVSIVEDRARRHLMMEYLVKQSAYRLLGHTLYERFRGKVAKEKMG